jgi:6-phosphogluconolactonase
VQVVMAGDVAREAAALLEVYLAERLSDADRVSLAVSGGTTPWATLERLAAASLPWARIDLYQVDERIVAPEHPARNLALLRAALVNRVPATVHAMPVDAADLIEAANDYAASLPERIDIVQLGLGADGHTASLVPGDPVLTASADVAVTGPYQGYRRMTLTFSPLNRARRVVWIVAGEDKRDAVERLLARDPSIPAGRISPANAVLVADRAALGR